MNIKSFKSAEIELSPTGSNLYIFFGGIASGIVMPPFEFYNASKIINEHKVFIRDFTQCWYQNGLLDISNDIDTTLEYIRSIIETIKPKKLFFVGNSMGGYAVVFKNLCQSININAKALRRNRLCPIYLISMTP